MKPPTLGAYHELDGLKYFSNQPDPHLVKPEIIVVSGIHGDETPVVIELYLLLLQIWHELPPTVFVPIVSTLAAQAGTRLNPSGEDLNRIMDQSPLSFEAYRAQRFMRLFGPARLLLSVHQDSDLAKHLYLYTEGMEIPLLLLNRWRRELFTGGYLTLSNLDDPNDKVLGMLARDGYIHHRDSHKTPQMFESWAVNSGLVDQAITAEIPLKTTARHRHNMMKATLHAFLLGQ